MSFLFVFYFSTTKKLSMSSWPPVFSHSAVVRIRTLRRILREASILGVTRLPRHLLRGSGMCQVFWVDVMMMTWEWLLWNKWKQLTNLSLKTAQIRSRINPTSCSRTFQLTPRPAILAPARFFFNLSHNLPDACPFWNISRNQFLSKTPPLTGPASLCWLALDFLAPTGF